MVHHPLAVVMLPARNDFPHIACFHRINSFGYHVLIGLIHSALIIRYRTRGLMMHDQTQTFGLRILRQRINRIIRIWAHKIEYFLFPISKPIFPALIPAFHQNAIKSMLGRKVNITLHIRCICPMFSACQWPIRLPNVHFPPHPHEFLRLNPRGISKFGRLI